MTAIVQQTDTADFILTPEEAWEVFDSHVSQAMPGVTGEEFVRRWNAGEFAAVADRPGYLHITRLALMIPGGKR